MKAGGLGQGKRPQERSCDTILPVRAITKGLDQFIVFRLFGGGPLIVKGFEAGLFPAYLPRWALCPNAPTGDLCQFVSGVGVNPDIPAWADTPLLNQFIGRIVQPRCYVLLICHA